MPKRIYPLELHTFITEHAAGTTNKKLADLINARFGDGYMTESQVKAYRKNHHLPSGLPKGRATYFSRIFPEPVVRYIMDNYVGTGPTEMAGKLNAAFETNYTVAQINGYYSNHHLNCGITGRFEKGHVPANKGKHPPTVGRMAETQFMKGHLPHNTKPIGYERINKDGYVEVKVKMRPSSPYCNDNFIPKHRLLWEAENGPVPKGHKLIFADGDKTNISLDNLLLITDAQIARLNKSGFVKVDKDLTVASLQERVRDRAQLGGIMQSVEISGLKEIQKKLEGYPEAMKKARSEFFEEAGREMLSTVRRRIGGQGYVANVQDRHVGSGRGYAAVRAKAKTELRGYAAGYVTNALEGGHVQTPGRYVPAMGKKLKANRVKGKYMYRKTAAELPQIAERGAQEIEKKAMAYLEGKG